MMFIDSLDDDVDSYRIEIPVIQSRIRIEYFTGENEQWKSNWTNLSNEQWTKIEQRLINWTTITRQ